jgi:hypothetical protein
MLLSVKNNNINVMKKSLKDNAKNILTELLNQKFYFYATVKNFVAFAYLIIYRLLRTPLL